ncbi:MAG: DHH family phosphoesterase [Clostridia bacterium]|nr:DHH family phosphoesterase [Clostridia bacterium]
MASNNKFFDNLVSKTKIYLVIIAILFFVLCIIKPICIIPSILIYLGIVVYTMWTDKKRKAELSEHIKELNFNVDKVSKRSLINSPFPLLIAETNGNIIWKNTKFVQEFNNYDINKFISSLLKEIKLEIENNEKIKNNKLVTDFEIEKKKYKVVGEYIRSKSSTRTNEKKQEKEYMATLYFLDETEKERLAEDIEKTRVCIGVIKIDNYEETMQRIEDEDQAQILAKIEKNIYDWANEFKGVIIKSERDTFILVCEQRDLEKLKEEKFSLLDTIKGINMPEKVQATLSISITNEGDGNYQKLKYAKDGIDIALGRGGDQAVVRENGKYTFFGGRTEKLEKITKVKARTVSQALEEIMLDSNKIFIMGHSNGDMDSMGSSLGIYRIAKTLKKDAYIINETNGMSLEKFMEVIKEDESYRDAIITKDEAVAMADNESLVVVVDTNRKNYVEAPDMLNITNRVVVIDHHRMSTEYIENPILSFQEVYASSACELVTELIVYSKNNIKLATLEVEALYAGIMMDTKNFTFKTGVRTFEAAAYLRRCGVDIIKVKKWFQSDFETYTTVSEIVAKAEIVYDSIALAVYDKEDENANIIGAKAADTLLTISDISASFVIGRTANKVFISGRSIGDINVQVILEKMGGGGHITLAGAQIEGKTIDEVKMELISNINDYFIENI